MYNIYVHICTQRDIFGLFFILLRQVCFVIRVRYAEDSLVLLGACSAFLVDLVLVLPHSGGTSAMVDTTRSWSCEDPSKPSPLFSADPILVRHLPVWTINGSCMCQVTGVHPAVTFTPPGKPGQLSSTPTTGSLLCAIRQIWRQFSPVPFGRSLVSF